MNNFDLNLRELDMLFVVFCCFCRKKFKIGVFLRKYYELKYYEGSFFEIINIFVDEFGNCCYELKVIVFGNDVEF